MENLIYSPFPARAAILPKSGRLMLFALLFRTLRYNIRRRNFSAIKNLLLLAIVTIARPLRVILADDDEEDRELFREVVEDIGSNVNLSMIEDGEDLMIRLKTGIDLPDLIFLDLNMPVKNGHECLKEIRDDKNLQHIPVIIYSTSSSRDQIDLTFREGANLYITKPDSINDLRRIARKVFSLDWKNAVEPPRKDNFVLKVGHLD
jgi:CheY-like chemotaxis protein